MKAKEKIKIYNEFRDICGVLGIVLCLALMIVSSTDNNFLFVFNNILENIDGMDIISTFTGGKRQTQMASLNINYNV